MPHQVGTDARSKEIVAYQTFLVDAGRITDEFYRRTALHSQNTKAWSDSVVAAALHGWPNFAWPRKPPAFTWDAFIKEAGRRFGAITTGFGVTGGFSDMHYGHTVSDGRHTVTQYGHTSAFRFVQLDEMVSNGFLSWFWDGSSADGGWQNSEMVVQVRPSYANGPLRSWTSLTDSAQRRTINETIATDSVLDLARARITPIAYFPSVTERLARAAESALLDSLRRSGLDGEALRERFVRILGDETQEYSIFQHEGRHAIDNGVDEKGNCTGKCKSRKGLFTSTELELRAKLSQVVFAPRPELAVGSIMAPGIGNETPHGAANALVMRGVADWMIAHAGEIAHLDRDAPMLPQLPLLTSAQLRAAFRSLDPLAK